MVETVKFMNEADRRRVVQLAWPLSLNGKEYHEIHLARLTTKEVATFVEQLSKMPEDTRFVWPIFKDAEGTIIPAEVMEALDDDDRTDLDKVALDFLPRRFLGDREPVSAQADGGFIAPSSLAPSDGV